jgi:hypothetical protein
VCKIIIDSGRMVAANDQLSRNTQATAQMVGDAILRGILRPDDPTVAKINERLCYWAEAAEKWNAELFAMATVVAQQPPARRDRDDDGGG